KTFCGTRNERFAVLEFEYLPMFRVVVTHGEKGCGNFLRQRVVDAALGGEAAVAIPRALPEDPHAIIRKTPLGAQRRNGVPTNRTSVVFPGHHHVYHRRL